MNINKKFADAKAPAAHVAIWMALIGFDRDKPDKGASEYLSNLGFTPSAISLFVQNPDLLLFHQDMDEERLLPRDCCNYYGALVNEIRAIQPWTNYDLKELGANLKKAGVETYLGFMGTHLCPLDENDDSTVPNGIMGYPCKIDFMLQHKELTYESTLEKGYINLFKNFNDGTSFEDFFINQALKTLIDYDIDGIHFSDSIFPPCIGVKNGDFSDFMLNSFIDCYPSLNIPKELRLSLKDKNSPGINARAEYIWKNHRIDWITFYAERWGKFFTKLCSVLHKAGKKVMVNNSWTSEPFESLYRFGIDYKILERSGIDIICVENQATTQMNSDGGRYKIHEHMLMPAIMKAYAPKMETLAFNFTRDSTEENSALDHFPCPTERELYALASTLYTDKEGSKRAIDGYFVCLGDGVRKHEWNWLNQRYRIALSGDGARALTYTLMWSDAMVFDFLPDYIKTRRWSLHKIASELSKNGAKYSAVARISDISSVSGTILVPNADLLNEEEKKLILNYKNGAVIFTSVSGKKDRFNGFKNNSDIFEDRFVKNPAYCMCAGILNRSKDNQADIQALLNIDGSMPEITDTAAVVDNDFWFYDIPFNKVSDGFIKALAQVIIGEGNPYFYLESVPKFYDLFSPVKTAPDNIEIFSAHETKSGRVKIILENDRYNTYRHIHIMFKRPVKKIINVMEFPIIPLKLILEEGIRAYSEKYEEHIKRAKGCVVKIPPGGVQVIELDF